MAAGGDQTTAILIKKAKIAMNHTIKWKRNVVEAPMHIEQQQNQQSHHKKQYDSNTLKRTGCGHRKKTSWMQLRPPPEGISTYIAATACASYTKDAHTTIANVESSGASAKLIDTIQSFAGPPRQ